MNKLAVFVEGYTEVVFVKKLIEEIAGQNNVLIDHSEIRGGGKSGKVKRTARIIEGEKPNTGQEYYVIIYDCGNDEGVRTRIREDHETLTESGYSRLIGVRDVRPDFTYEDIPRLEANLPLYIKTKWAPVTFILSIMEIEAWFLADSSHFPRIEPSITVAAIKANLGFDPENDDMEQRVFPAKDLDDCYKLGGKSYVKHQAKDTVDALDYEFIYIELRKKINYLDKLISVIDAFLA
ncbi:MAG: hypothetical protein WA821_18265 [Anaerolineales bacterium]